MISMSFLVTIQTDAKSDDLTFWPDLLHLRLPPIYNTVMTIYRTLMPYTLSLSEYGPYAVCIQHPPI